MIRFTGLIAPTEVPTGDGRMFASGKATHRPLPIPLMAKFGSGSHMDATPVGKITEIFAGPGGYWAKGNFLDAAMIPEVPRTVYMLQEKVMGPSVDLDLNFTVKQQPHPTRPDKSTKFFEEYNIIGTTLVPMPAFHQVHLSVDTDEEKTILASAGVDLSLLVADLDELDLGNPELIEASINSDDEAECGCTEESSQEFSQGIVPVSEANYMVIEPGTPNAFTFTVNGVQNPTSVTLTFDGGMYRYDMPGYHKMPDGSTMPNHMMEDKQPLAVVKVLEDKTVVKVPHFEEKEECYFDDDGNCPVCGY